MLAFFLRLLSVPSSVVSALGLSLCLVRFVGNSLLEILIMEHVFICGEKRCKKTELASI